VGRLFKKRDPPRGKHAKWRRGGFTGKKPIIEHVAKKNIEVVCCYARLVLKSKGERALEKKGERTLRGVSTKDSKLMGGALV